MYVKILQNAEVLCFSAVFSFIKRPHEIFRIDAFKNKHVILVIEKRFKWFSSYSLCSQLKQNKKYSWKINLISWIKNRSWYFLHFRVSEPFLICLFVKQWEAWNESCWLSAVVGMKVHRSKSLDYIWRESQERTPEADKGWGQNKSSSLKFRNKIDVAMTRRRRKFWASHCLQSKLGDQAWGLLSCLTDQTSIFSVVFVTRIY